uniref:Putative transcription factor SEF1 n=1 Tax=Anthurium amnicola TaxID=1678845 RepID=A0A1D1XJ72_9ARAE
MTATRPVTSKYNHVNHQSNNVNNVLTKRTRGPINKRACQRCRQGKIKCDGDAESGKPCSNCDPQHCKYDNSPRKNKQVESLKLRLNAVEEQLIAITNDVNDQLQTKDVEKEIICLLYESKEHFNGYDSLFEGLRDALKQSRCIRPVLPITYELLKRLGERKCIPGIMDSLQRFVDCANSDSLYPVLSNSTDVFKKIEENYNIPQYPANDNILPVDSAMMMQLPLDNNEGEMIQHDEGSDSPGFEFADDTSGGPNTPPQQQIHPESKCFNNNNNTSQNNVTHQSPIMASTAPSDFGGFYEYPYYQNQFNNVMDNNYAMNFLPTTTTSPTDEPITSWNISN